MKEARRQELNLRAIRISLGSALRHLERNEVQATLARANQLLAEARRVASTPAIEAEIEALQALLDQRLDRDESEGG